MRKIKIDVSDKETKRTWDSAKKTARRVAEWPAWKRGSTVELDNDLEAAYSIWKKYRDAGLIVSEVAMRFMPKNFDALEARYQKEQNA